MVEHLNNTVYCTLKPSPIHGVGVFAIRDIPQGTEVNHLSHDVVTLTEEEFNLLLPEVQHEILEHVVLVEDEPLSFYSPNRICDFRAWMNHADEPNTDGIRALQDIKKGEEITEDFRTMGPIHPMSRKHMSFLWK